MVTYCSLSRGFLVTTAAYAAVAAVAVVLSGCDRHRSFHQNFDLEAGAFFKDQSIVALCHAIERNDLELMQRLIDGGVDVNARGKDNVTPLLWAYPDNKPERLEVLLRAGADPNVKLTGNLGIPAAF